MKQLQVLRSEMAKEFPLIAIAKDGDVGMDLFACLPLKENHEQLLKDYYDECGRKDEKPCSMDSQFIKELIHETITIMPGERGVIPTGIRLGLPSDRWASIEARSSTSKKMLVVPKGVIDQGYRGELFAVILNLGTNPVTIYHGDRYVQLILHKREIADIEVIEVDKLSETERGDSGFGSTGR